MRITGGQFKGRKLATPPGDKPGFIRPTTDRVREALFSILGRRLPGSKVLDLFAGTGCFGVEALSRGAESVVFVDSHPAALKLISRNLAACGQGLPAHIVRLDLSRRSSFLSLTNRLKDVYPFSIVFMDPPYEKKMAETTLTMVEKTGLVATSGVVVVEERWNADLPDTVGSLRLELHRRYGETGIWMYSRRENETSPQQSRP
ncbi:MAG: 16S rRNA (guanine(966)-N(2))-methyltransferase RsmD [Desulfobulbaceae bacterium]